MADVSTLVESGVIDPSVVSGVTLAEVNGDGSWKAEQRCVYILRSGRYYKIGFAQDVAKRLSNINTSSPRPSTLVYAVETTRFRELEKALHERFSKRRTQREWFALTRRDLSLARLIMFAESWDESDFTDLDEY